MAGHLRGGGKGFFIFFLFVALEKKDILIKMTYRNINIQVYMLNFVVGQQIPCLLTGLLKYLQINMALLVQKLGRGKKSSKSVSGILRLK